jgi:hypothetical protein
MPKHFALILLTLSLSGFISPANASSVYRQELKLLAKEHATMKQSGAKAIQALYAYRRPVANIAATISDLNRNMATLFIRKKCANETPAAQFACRYARESFAISSAQSVVEITSDTLAPQYSRLQQVCRDHPATCKPGNEVILKIQAMMRELRSKLQNAQRDLDGVEQKYRQSLIDQSLTNSVARQALQKYKIESAASVQSLGYLLNQLSMKARFSVLSSNGNEAIAAVRAYTFLKKHAEYHFSRLPLSDEARTLLNSTIDRADGVESELRRKLETIRTGSKRQKFDRLPALTAFVETEGGKDPDIQAYERSLETEPYLELDENQYYINGKIRSDGATGGTHLDFTAKERAYFAGDSRGGISITLSDPAQAVSDHKVSSAKFVRNEQSSLASHGMGGLQELNQLKYRANRDAQEAKSSADLYAPGFNFPALDESDDGYVFFKNKTVVDTLVLRPGAVIRLAIALIFKSLRSDSSLPPEPYLTKPGNTARQIAIQIEGASAPYRNALRSLLEAAESAAEHARLFNAAARRYSSEASDLNRAINSSVVSLTEQLSSLDPQSYVKVPNFNEPQAIDLSNFPSTKLERTLSDDKIAGSIGDAATIEYLRNALAELQNKNIGPIPDPIRSAVSALRNLFEIGSSEDHDEEVVIELIKQIRDEKEIAVKRALREELNNLMRNANYSPQTRLSNAVLEFETQIAVSLIRPLDITVAIRNLITDTDLITGEKLTPLGRIIQMATIANPVVKHLRDPIARIVKSKELYTGSKARLEELVSVITTLRTTETLTDKIANPAIQNFLRSSGFSKIVAHTPLTSNPLSKIILDVNATFLTPKNFSYPLDRIYIRTVADTFVAGSYMSVTLSKPMTLYRVTDTLPAIGMAPSGRFFSPLKALGSLAARLEYNLGMTKNAAAHLSEVLIPAGTVIHIGKVAAHGGVPPGTLQVFVEHTSKLVTLSTQTLELVK